jgi:basic membrane protein A
VVLETTVEEAAPTTRATAGRLPPVGRQTRIKQTAGGMFMSTITHAPMAFAAGLVAVAALAAGCGSTDQPAGTGSSSGAAKGSKSIALIINGNLGDGGFFDNANAGVSDTAKQVGIPEKTIETGYTPTKWEPALNDAAAGDYNVIIAGSFPMKELVEQAAAQHPDKQFVLFDVEADKKACGGCTNIYSITYRYRETGYLAGVVAGQVTVSGMPRTNKAAVVGFVGGQDIPVIRDYMEGYVNGVKAVNPNAKVLTAFAGTFNDPVKGKQLASGMIGKGADVVFTAAGDTDKGTFEAAADHDVWAIGNSLNQARDNRVNGKVAILTSSNTSVQNSLRDAVERIAKGDLPVGQTRSFGVKEKTNYIVDSGPYKQFVPQAIRNKVTQIEQGIADGTTDAG